MWLGWLIVGGLAGLVANSVMQTRMGLIVDIIIGFLGAFGAGYLFSVSGQPGITGFNLWSIFVAFMGAVFFLSSIRLVSGNRHIAEQGRRASQRVEKQLKLALSGLAGKRTIPIQSNHSDSGIRLPVDPQASAVSDRTGAGLSIASESREAPVPADSRS